MQMVVAVDVILKMKMSQWGLNHLLSYKLRASVFHRAVAVIYFIDDLCF